jgi:hypothetical protein
MMQARTSRSLRLPVMMYFPVRSRFLTRPQLLIHSSPLPMGRDISRTPLAPELLASNWLHLSEADSASYGDSGTVEHVVCR